MSMETCSLTVVLTTFPDRQQAMEALKPLVADGLVLCAQVGQNMSSLYNWDGELCCDEEVPVHLKCLTSKLEELEERYHQLHPYDCPQWICMQADHVSKGYAEWALQNGGDVPG